MPEEVDLCDICGSAILMEIASIEKRYGVRITIGRITRDNGDD